MSTHPILGSGTSRGFEPCLCFFLIFFFFFNLFAELFTWLLQTREVFTGVNRCIAR